MLAGNVVEFWQVLLQDKPNAQAAVGSGEETWAGTGGRRPPGGDGYQVRAADTL